MSAAHRYLPTLAARPARPTGTRGTRPQEGHQPTALPVLCPLSCSWDMALERRQTVAAPSVTARWASKYIPAFHA